MTESDLTCRFLEELKDAIQKWESGDKQPMVDNENPGRIFFRWMQIYGRFFEGQC